MGNYKTLTHLGDIPVEKFLQEYWQKKPLLIRNALPNFHSPLSADELAGLSLEEDVVSRLIVETQNPSSPDNPKNTAKTTIGLDYSSHWEMQHGPLNEKTFESLPENLWTLLIQHADLLDPDINAMLDAFRFIPRWRVDDIMVSYASNGGGVGPHFDYYDVFLLQGEGKREWRIGQQCDEHSPLLENQPLKILREFDTRESWVLEPGDILYVPPCIAHWGCAIDESITYSIGFRAPSHSELLLEFCQEAAAGASEDKRYRDSALKAQDNPGQINQEVIDSVRQILSHYTHDQNLLARTFGELMTQPNPGGEDTMLEALSMDDIKNDEPFILSPFVRYAFYLDDKDDTRALCFINGISWPCSVTLAKELDNKRPLTWTIFSAADQRTLELICKHPFLISAEHLD